MAVLFLAHLAALAVLVYACSWLPIEDKTAAYLVACTAYLATVVVYVLRDILARVTMMQRELLHAHDDLIGFKHEAREQRRNNGERQ
jgi:membrane protein implicated in regulation of membrane protease activity